MNEMMEVLFFICGIILTVSFAVSGAIYLADIDKIECIKMGNNWIEIDNENFNGCFTDETFEQIKLLIDDSKQSSDIEDKNGI